MFKKIFFSQSIFWPAAICLLFFAAFSVLSVVRHLNYQSFGYDLGINDQVVWSYAHFKIPISTIDPFPMLPKFAEHVELIYALVAPFYWIYMSPITLILVRNGWFCFSAIALYLFARKKGLNYFLSLALVVSYLGFYGVQFAIWTDVHSNSFASAFLIWFIYFLETKQKKLSITAFLLAITAKENIGLATFLISFIYFIQNRSKLLFFFMAASVAYVAFIFFVFFPYIMHVKYLYQNPGGLFSNLNPESFFDTSEKRQVIWYSLLSFGFLPLLSPLYLIPAIGNLTMYFVIANDLPGAQGLFGHYRIGLAVFLTFATVYTFAKYKWLNKWYMSVYVIVFALVVQYLLHLPLSYLSKQWFWTKPPAAITINTVITDYLPKNASVVSQNNITPHISERDKILTLYPQKQTFGKNSPCGTQQCNWFRWDDNPTYLIVDTSSDWDIRHLLTNRTEFVDGIRNLEKEQVIKPFKHVGTTTLYLVIKNPNDVNFGLTK